jgi:hypothetical protein
LAAVPAEVEQGAEAGETIAGEVEEKTSDVVDCGFLTLGLVGSVIVDASEEDAPFGKKVPMVG